MATNYNSPGVFLVEKAGATGIPTVSAVNASTLAIAGQAKSGPTDKPTICLSMADFERVYGGQIAQSDMYLVLKSFFQNGGNRAAVLRIHNDAKTRVATIHHGATVPASAYEFTFKSAGVWANSFKIKFLKSAEAGALPTDVDITLSSNASEHGGDRASGYVDLEVFSNVSVLFADNANGAPNFLHRVINNGTSSYIALVEDKTDGSEDHQDYSSAVYNDETDVQAGTDGTDVVEDDWDGAYVTTYASPFDVILENMLYVDCDWNTATALGDLESYAKWRADGFVIGSMAYDDYTAADAVAYRQASFPANGAGQVAAYWPWVQTYDPLRKENRYITPVGHIAGIYARTDTYRNIGKAPAGIADGQLVGLTDIGMSDVYRNIQLKRSDLDTLYLGKVNPLLADPIVGMAVWGARSTSTVDEWKFIQARRLFMFVEQSIKNSVQWVVFENNGPDLWTKIKMQIGGFLSNLFADGYFAGATPDDAYYVVCDATNNSANDQNNGLLQVDVGIAPNKPAEFVVLRFQQKTLTS